MLSGWKITNIVESIANLYITYGILREIGLSVESIEDIITMGDDLVIVLDMDRVSEVLTLSDNLTSIEKGQYVLHKISQEYKKYRFTVHPHKNSYGYHFIEFLRVAYYCTYVKGYPIRNMLSLYYRKPISEIENNDIQILESNCNKIINRVGNITYKNDLLCNFMRLSKNDNLVKNTQYAYHPERFGINYEQIPLKGEKDNEKKKINRLLRGDYYAYIKDNVWNQLKAILYNYHNIQVTTKQQSMILDYFVKRISKKTMTTATLVRREYSINKNLRFIHKVNTILSNIIKEGIYHEYIQVKNIDFEYPIPDYHAIDLFEIVREVLHLTKLVQWKSLLLGIYRAYAVEFKLNKEHIVLESLNLIENKTQLRLLLKTFKIPIKDAYLPAVITSSVRKLLNKVFLYKGLLTNNEGILTKKSYNGDIAVVIGYVTRSIFVSALSSVTCSVPIALMFD